MNTKEKELVISLIHDDLISRKLIFMLRRAGIYADDYLTNISMTIFRLMDIPDEDEEIYEKYADLTEHSEYIEIEGGNHTLEPLAHHIYNFLNRYSKS